MKVDKPYALLVLIIFNLFLPNLMAEKVETTERAKMNANEISSTKGFMVGGDISALTKIEAHEGVFRDEDTPAGPIEIMMRHGCNCFRVRLFVNPTHRNVVVNDLAYTIALAKRIKGRGTKLLLNFHYSDTWADPGHQHKPKAWENLDFERLTQTVYEYTRDCIIAMKGEGVWPDIVQVGNEITPGMLWPDGKLYGVGAPDVQWQKLTRLLKAGIRGVKEADTDIQILLHIDRGGDWQGTEWFFSKIEEHDVSYDIIGLSYYPWWHGKMDALAENLHKTAMRFDKDIFVVETAYPYSPMTFSKVQGWEERMQWPMTPAGQKEFLAELVHIVQQTPNRRGIGVLWWYPESILVNGLHVWNGGATALFDAEGNTLPAMKGFQNR